MGKLKVRSNGALVEWVPKKGFRLVHQYDRRSTAISQMQITRMLEKARKRRLACQR